MFGSAMASPVGIDAHAPGMIRTGAASGVATRHMAREDAAVVAMIGAGKQAIGQLEAVCAVRKIRHVKVFSRNPERAKSFCESMSAKLGVTMEAVANAADAVRGVDVVNVSVTVSLVSTIESSRMGTSTLRFVMPGLKVSVLVTPVKSAPLVALPEVAWKSTLWMALLIPIRYTVIVPLPPFSATK